MLHGFGFEVHHGPLCCFLPSLFLGGGSNGDSLAKSIRIRPMTIDDLSPVFELGERVYPAELYPNLFRIWSEAEVVESFGESVWRGEVVGSIVRT